MMIIVCLMSAKLFIIKFYISTSYNNIKLLVCDCSCLAGSNLDITACPTACPRKICNHAWESIKVMNSPFTGTISRLSCAKLFYKFLGLNHACMHIGL